VLLTLIACSQFAIEIFHAPGALKAGPASAIANYVMDNMLRLVALLVGAVIGWRRAGLVSFRGFAAAGLLAGTGYPHSAPAAAHWVWLDFFSSVAHDLWPAALLLFAIDYPDDKPVGPRAVLKRCYPWVLAVHVTVLLGFNLRLYAGFFEPGLHAALKTLLIGLSVLFFLGIVLGWRHARGESRARFRWIMVTLGSLVATTLVEPLMSLSGQRVAAESFKLAIPAAQLLAILGLVYAILRHRLFDFGVAINRTLVFAIVGAILLGAMQIANGIVSAFLHFEDNNRTILLGAILAVIVSLSFNQLKSLVERVVDRVFFSRWVASEGELRRFVDEALYVSDPNVLGRSLVTALDRFTGGAGCAVFRKTDGGYSREDGTLFNAPKTVDANHEVVLAMRSHRKGVCLGSSSSSLGRALALPMAQRGQLHGFVLVGSRSSGDPYRADEIEALGSAVHHVGKDFHALKIEALELEIEAQRASSALLRAQLSTALRILGCAAPEAHAEQKVM
jgi:hypothetical protein